MRRKYYNILVCNEAFGKLKVSPSVGTDGYYAITMTSNDWTYLQDNIGM